MTLTAGRTQSQVSHLLLAPFGARRLQSFPCKLSLGKGPPLLSKRAFQHKDAHLSDEGEGVPGQRELLCSEVRKSF